MLTLHQALTSRLMTVVEMCSTVGLLSLPLPTRTRPRLAMQCRSQTGSCLASPHERLYGYGEQNPSRISQSALGHPYFGRDDIRQRLN